MYVLQIVSNKWKQKYAIPETYYINRYYANVIKFMKIISNSTQNRQETQMLQKDKKLVFEKNW